MRTFSPFAIWSQVPLANRTASIIKSLQYTTVTFTGSNVKSGTTTITSVNTAKTVLIPLGQSGAVTLGCRFSLQDSTTVKMETDGDVGGGAATYKGGVAVVEFY